MPLSVTVCAGVLGALDMYIQAAEPHATGTADVICLECARCDLKAVDMSSVFPLLVVLRAPRSKIANPPLVCRPNNCLISDTTNANDNLPIAVAQVPSVSRFVTEQAGISATAGAPVLFGVPQRQRQSSDQDEWNTALPTIERASG